MKNLLTKAMVATAITGMVGFGTLQWMGSSDIEAVQSMYNRLYDNYQTALGNITVYKNELARRGDLIKGSSEKQVALQNKIDELKQQLETAQGGSEQDKQRIAELEQQIADLQAQLDESATEEELNQLTAEIERLQNELNKANTEVASLKEQIALKDASITDIQPVTAEEVQGDTDIADLYFTFATSNNNTALDNYLNGLQVIDMYNQSPALVISNGNSYSMPNMIAFQQAYDKVNGEGSFETAFNNAYNQYYANQTDMTEQEKVYNTLCSYVSLKVTVDGQQYTIRWQDGQITPNGESKQLSDWMSNDKLIMY